MLYLIGLGLNKESFTYEAKNVIKNCRKVYLENYTVKFPYEIEELQELIGKKIIELKREDVESEKLIKEAKEQNVALLVYGSPLIATTHISLIQEAKKKRINFRIIHNASILDAVSETGLQIYKFGKISSIPKFEADSFMEIIQENQSINAHSLILVDIGVNLKDSLKKLERASERYKIKLEKILICSRLGKRDQKIIYKDIQNLKKLEIKEPYCFIIPGKLHFLEEEFLRNFEREY
jgi:diphthine synthase